MEQLKEIKITYEANTYVATTKYKGETYSECSGFSPEEAVKNLRQSILELTEPETALKNKVHDIVYGTKETLTYDALNVIVNDINNYIVKVFSKLKVNGLLKEKKNKEVDEDYINACK